MIESTQNQQVKFWKKLKRKKYRDQEGLYIIEGDHLIQEALKHLEAEDIERLLVTEEKKSSFDQFPSTEITVISPAVASELADTEHSQGTFAIIRKAQQKRPQIIHKPYLFIDGIQDPGNLGSIIRTAAAADFEGVVLGKGTVDLYNMKVLRGAQGMHFMLDIYEGDLEDWIDFFHDHDWAVFGSSLGEATLPYQNIKASDQPFALMLGNEGAGSQQKLLDQTDLNLYIPLAQGVESLNVGVAAGILMFHLRQIK